MKTGLKAMNKLLLIAIYITMPTLVWSCSSENSDEPEPPVSADAVITATPTSLATGYEAATLQVEVTSTQDWSIKSDADWCTTIPTGGVKSHPTTINIKVTANNEIDARSTNITVTSSGKTLSIPLTQEAKPTLNVSTATVSYGAQASESTFSVETNGAWTASSDAAWCTVSPASGTAGTATVTIKAEANATNEARVAVITVQSGELSEKITVNQYTDEIQTPEGYTLVWHDEFNTPNGSMPDTELWYYDVWNPGFVNNELQRYVAGQLGDEKTAVIENGILNIIARKAGNEVISARINTRQLWTYGYFEARLKLPKGKGTWPAFWMMPSDGGNWPHCGEIDIMEEVGVKPNYTSSSIHCTSYNHTTGTQKTAERLTPGAEEEFHIYALEWTADYIRTYVDGKLLLSFANDKKNDENSWPFNKPFHPILNLAWGGDWGGMNGVDESALPATYQIDYVRVFQKNE